MAEAPNKERIISALESEWQSIRDLCSGFSHADWELPTDCPGWSVKDNLSHIIGTELFLAGEPFPEVEIPNEDHLKNDIAKMNESWVQFYRDQSPEKVLGAFDETVVGRTISLKALSQEEWDAIQPMTPVGPAPYGRFMQIRVLDNWMHEQDIRHAVNNFGNDGNESESLPVEVTLDEVSQALGFVVGKRGGAPEGCKVIFDLSGESGRKMKVEIKDGKGALVEELSGPADIKFHADISTFTRLIGGRQDPKAVHGEGKISVDSTDGFEEVAENILNNLGYMI